MTEHQYDYVQCDACAVEARKETTHSFGREYHKAPPGWLDVSNRDGKKLWDLCPECAKEFTKWLIAAAAEKQTPLGIAPVSKEGK